VNTSPLPGSSRSGPAGAPDPGTGPEPSAHDKSDRAGSQAGPAVGKPQPRFRWPF